MNFIRTVAIVWAAACLSLGAWVSHMVYFDNVPPYVWDEGPPLGASRMVPDPAKQQSMVTANWAIKEIRRVCPANLQRFFWNGETGALVTTLDTTEASRSVKKGDTLIPRSFQLPPDLPRVTDYSALACFECNAYQMFIKPLCVMTPKIRFHMAAAQP